MGEQGKQERRSPSRFWEWVRHHMASLVATVVDFSIMVGGVELVHLSPVVATVIGAACGGLTNFMLARHWTYRVAHAAARKQALRFALVSVTSLALNGGGEFLLHSLLGVQYVVARVIVALVVNNGWNYPMQRFFVFSARTPGLP